MAGVGLGLVLRVWILSSHALGTVDMDEAVSGLMARHVFDGDVKVFFWGQSYGGTQEAFATGALFAVFGASALALKIVPVLLYAAAALLVWRVGRRIVGEPAAMIAAVVFWIGPTFFVLRSTKAYGFYGTAWVVGLAILLAALRLRDRVTTAEVAWLGFLVGLGWWATPQVVFVAVPTSVWLCLRAPRVLRQAPVAAGSALVGASPWLVWNVTHGWGSLDTAIFAGIPDNSYLDHLRGFFNPLLPMALGLRVPYSRKWILGEGWSKAVYLALLVAFAAAVVRWLLRSPRHRGSADLAGNGEVLLLIAVAYPFLYSLSPTAFYLDECRYLFLLSPVVALLVAGVLSDPVRQWAGVAAVAFLSVAGLREINVPDGQAPRSLRPLLRALEQRGVEHLFAPYRIANRITFDSDEEIIAAPLAGGRWPPHYRAVHDSPSPAYAFAQGTPEQAQFEEALARRQVTAEKTTVGVFDVYEPATRFLPEDW